MDVLFVSSDNEKAGDVGGVAGKWFGESFTKQLNTGYETFKHMFTPGAVQTVPDDDGRDPIVGVGSD